MSDGNFNRALLPHTPYASGLKAGKAMARMRATEAFSEWMEAAFPSMTDEERKSQMAAFARILSRRLGV